METIRGWKEKNVSLLAARCHPYHFLVPMLICRKTVPGGHDIVSLDNRAEDVRHLLPCLLFLHPEETAERRYGESSGKQIIGCDDILDTACERAIGHSIGCDQRRMNGTAGTGDRQEVGGFISDFFIELCRDRVLSS